MANDKKYELVKTLEQSYSAALPNHVTTEHFSRALLTEFRKTPKLAECTRESLGGAVLTSAQLGLQIGVCGAAYLIPFKDKKRGLECQLVIGYQGLVDLCYRSGSVEAVWADVVYEHDEFVFEQGLEPKLVHKPKLTGNRGAMVAAYAVAHIKDSPRPVYTMVLQEEIKKIKKSSRGASSSFSPWNGDFESEMWKKTALRRLTKILPKSVEMQTAMQYEMNAEERYAKSAREVEAKSVTVDEVIGGTVTDEDAATPENPDAGNLEKDGCLSLDMQGDIMATAKGNKVSPSKLQAYIMGSMEVPSGKIEDVPADKYNTLKMWVDGQ